MAPRAVRNDRYPSVLTYDCLAKADQSTAKPQDWAPNLRLERFIQATVVPNRWTKHENLRKIAPRKHFFWKTKQFSKTKPLLQKTRTLSEKRNRFYKKRDRFYINKNVLSNKQKRFANKKQKIFVNEQTSVPKFFSKTKNFIFQNTETFFKTRVFVSSGVCVSDMFWNTCAC